MQGHENECSCSARLSIHPSEQSARRGGVRLRLRGTALASEPAEAWRCFRAFRPFLIIQMTSEGEVIAPDLQRLVWRIKAGGAESIGLLGSTGTCMFLSHDQRRRAVAAAVEAVASIPIIVDVGAMRTDEAQALARDAAEEGASGLLLTLVSYSH